MRWAISDFWILFLMMNLSVNGVVIVLLALKKVLMHFFDMTRLNWFFKGLVLYVGIVIPVMLSRYIYTSVIHEIYETGSSDFPYLYKIGNRTIGASTGWGNHWILILLLFLWGAGVLYYSYVYCIRDSILLKKIEHYGIACEDCVQMDRIVQKLAIRRPVTVYYSDIISTPFVIGMRKFKIFIPQAAFSEEEMEFILAHELTHCKNRDYVYRKELLFLSSLYWFNPCIRIFSDFFIEINEMACDEFVMENKTRKERYDYANLLIRVQEEKTHLCETLNLTGKSEESLERRIENIMKKENKRKGIVWVAVLLSVMVICPVSSLAATSKVMKIQNDFAEKMEDANYIQCEMKEYTEIVGNLSDDVEVESVLLCELTRGATEVDCEINGRESVVTTTLSLEKGDSVDITLRGENMEDRFNAGIIAEGGKGRWVTSQNGEINHMFIIENAGNYEVFVKGLSDNIIHVVGHIYVQ